MSEHSSEDDCMNVDACVIDEQDTDHGARSRQVSPEWIFEEIDEDNPAYGADDIIYHPSSYEEPGETDFADEFPSVIESFEEGSVAGSDAGITTQLDALHYDGPMSSPARNTRPWLSHARETREKRKRRRSTGEQLSGDRFVRRGSKDLTRKALKRREGESPGPLSEGLFEDREMMEEPISVRSG